jgi:hypothetical protein
MTAAARRTHVAHDDRRRFALRRGALPGRRRLLAPVAIRHYGTRGSSASGAGSTSGLATACGSINHWSRNRPLGVKPSRSNNASSAPSNPRRPRVMSSTSRSARRSATWSHSIHAPRTGDDHHSRHVRTASVVHSPPSSRSGIGGTVGAVAGARRRQWWRSGRRVCPGPTGYRPMRRRLRPTARSGVVSILRVQVPAPPRHPLAGVGPHPPTRAARRENRQRPGGPL